MSYETLKLSRSGHVVHVELNRPKAGNAMNSQFWKDYYDCFTSLQSDPHCRAIVVSGAGTKYFSVGLDLKDQSQMGSLAPDGGDGDKPKTDVARKAWKTKKSLQAYQDAFSAMEDCPPVIVAVHGACIGGAIDLLTAADIRVASKDAWFSVKEVDIGLAADVGTLQRIQGVVGNNSVVREWCYTARRFNADEALNTGFLSSVHDTKDAAVEHAFHLAQAIATKSPVATRGTKINLNYSRDHGVKESLEYMAVWNAAMLQTEDIPKAAIASITKSDQPEFSKL